MISMGFCSANFRNYRPLKDSSRDFGCRVPPSLRTQSRIIWPSSDRRIPFHWPNARCTLNDAIFWNTQLLYWYCLCLKASVQLQQWLRSYSFQSHTKPWHVLDAFSAVAPRLHREICFHKESGLFLQLQTWAPTASGAGFLAVAARCAQFCCCPKLNLSLGFSFFQKIFPKPVTSLKQNLP